VEPVYEVQPEWQEGEKEPKMCERRITSQRSNAAMVAALGLISALGPLLP
jgi:hypothetical protein